MRNIAEFRCRPGRSPHGERGLKYIVNELAHALDVSLPPRGAWIEMPSLFGWAWMAPGRSPHGERGLKYVQAIYQRFPKKLSNPLN